MYFSHPCVPGSGQSDNIMWTSFDTYATTGAKFCLEIKDYGFSILDPVDLIFGNWIYGMQLQCVNRACHHTIVTAGTMLHVNMHCKCHS